MPSRVRANRARAPGTPTRWIVCDSGPLRWHEDKLRWCQLFDGRTHSGNPGAIQWGVCYKQGLIEVHNERLGEIAAQRDLWRAQQQVSRARKALNSEPSEEQ